MDGDIYLMDKENSLTDEIFSIYPILMAKNCINVTTEIKVNQVTSSNTCKSSMFKVLRIVSSRSRTKVLFLDVIIRDV